MSRTFKVTFDNCFGDSKEYIMDRVNKPIIKSIKRRLIKKRKQQYVVALMIRGKTSPVYLPF